MKGDDWGGGSWGGVLVWIVAIGTFVLGVYLTVRRSCW